MTMARTLRPTPARPVGTLLDAHNASASSQRAPIPPLSPVDEASLADSLRDDTDAEDARPPEHPFANTHSLITVIHDEDDDAHIDLAAERAFYGQFPGAEDAAVRPDYVASSRLTDCVRACAVAGGRRSTAGRRCSASRSCSARRSMRATAPRSRATCASAAGPPSARATAPTSVRVPLPRCHFT